MGGRKDSNWIFFVYTIKEEKKYFLMTNHHVLDSNSINNNNNNISITYKIKLEKIKN